MEKVSIKTSTEYDNSHDPEFYKPEIYAIKIDGDNLVVKVNKLEKHYVYSYEKERYKRRNHYPSKPEDAILLPFWIFGCVISFGMECKEAERSFKRISGSSSDWEYYTSTSASTKTGEYDLLTTPFDDQEVEVSLKATDEKSQNLSMRTDYRGEARIDLKERLFTHDKRPENVTILVKTEEEQEIAELEKTFNNPYPVETSDQWHKNHWKTKLADKSAKVQHDAYMKEVTEQMRRKNHKKAVMYFELLSELKTNKPESFNFFYGKELLSFGSNSDAKRVLNRYIDTCGASGKYYDQAQKLLRK